MEKVENFTINGFDIFENCGRLIAGGENGQAYYDIASLLSMSGEKIGFGFKCFFQALTGF